MALIPGGSSLHGLSQSEVLELTRAYPGYEPDRYAPETPRRSVSVPTFAIDVFPVTCGAYRLAVDLGVVDAPVLWEHPDWLHPTYPVVGVSWYEASAYADWLGCKLPTEMQWEKAAGWDAATGTKRRFPRGPDWEPARCLNAELLLGRPINSRDEWLNAFWDGGAGALLGTLESVGLRDDASAYGVRMMAGHVWEWTRDLFLRAGEAVDGVPAGARAVRGGSWIDDWNSCRTTYRTWSRPEAWRFGPTDIGFRCVCEEPRELSRLAEGRTAGRAARLAGSG